jgi:hypothetical protein
MTDVASKQQTTALFLSNIDTRTRRQNWKKKRVMGNLCCAREHAVQQATRDVSRTDSITSFPWSSEARGVLRHISLLRLIFAGL